MTLNGFIDDVGVRWVRGWACDGGAASPELIVSIDGSEVTRGLADTIRPDLAGLTERPAGFQIALPCPVEPGCLLSITDTVGRPLQNSPLRVKSVTGGKKEKALCAVSRDMKILEIGPAYSPAAPRSEGWNSFSVDHASQEELRKKYAGQQPIELIEKVDFIWRGGLLDDAVPSEHLESFDAIVVSHVIEHFPDPIGFYLSASRLLKRSGLVCLVVPDKRVMFDFFKPISTTGDLLAAHFEGRTRHARKTAFDNIAYNSFSRNEIAWRFREFDNFTIASGMTSLREAKGLFDTLVSDESGSYVDFHNTVYTPSSFLLTILELGHLGVIPFRVAYSYPTQGCEFYVTLRKAEPERMDDDTLTKERLRLLKHIVRELGEQARWLVDD